MSGTTPFPNEFLDEVMPTLGDTEWRVICVIVRATHGWRREEGARKRFDWLSHTQLKRRTGRESEAVSRAIHRLVRRGLVEIRSATGEPIPTRNGRRRHVGRLYFGVRPLVAVDKSRKSEDRKAKTTKETHTKESPKKRGWKGRDANGGWVRVGAVCSGHLSEKEAHS